MTVSIERRDSMFTKNKKLLSLLLCGSLLLGAGAVDKKVASAEESTQNTASTTEKY